MDALAVGSVVQDRYHIEGVAGRGAMGVVYRARDSHLQDRIVALKQMARRPDAPDWDRALEAFLREAHLLASLSHPALVRVSDCFEENGSAYLVMDFVAGETLSQRLAHRGPATVEEVRVWADQMCDALVYLHTLQPPIVLRDLKPANLMLDGQGRVRLIDFGLARIFNTDHGVNTRTLGAGTAGYAAVEQYSGQVCGPRADIYSLGATLYTLLSGQVPPPSVDLAFNHKPLTPLRRLNPAVPAGLASTIGAMMAVQEDARPSSVAEVRTRLHQPEPTFSKLPRVPVGVLIAVVILLFTATGVVRHQSGPSQTVLVDRYVPFRQLVFAPSGDWLAGSQATVYGRPGGDVWIWDARSGALQQKLSGPAGDMMSVAFSSDGLALVAASATGVVQRWDTGTWQAAEPWQLMGSDHWISSMALSPDRRTVALLMCPQYRPAQSADGDQSHPEIWNLETHEKLATLDTVGARALAFSADGRTLATGGQELKLWDTTTWALEKTLAGHGLPIDSVAFSSDGTLATGAEDRTIIIWDLDTSAPGQHLVGHGSAVVGLAFAAHTPVLVSGDNHDLRFWDTRNWTSLQVLPLSRNAGPSTLALAPDDETLATSGSATVILWHWPRPMP